MIKYLVIAAGLSVSTNALAEKKDWSWSPVAASQTENFTQVRENKDKSMVSRAVNVVVSNWSSGNNRIDCTPWSPDASTQPLNSNFSQSRTCYSNKFRRWNYFAEGGVIHERIEWDKEPKLENRMFMGSGDSIVSTTWENYTGWENSGSPFGCGAWSPSSSTVGLGETFGQKRTCYINQTRYRLQKNVWASGSVTYSNKQSESRVGSITDTQSSTGTLANGWVYMTTMYSAWTDYDQASGQSNIECDNFKYPPNHEVSFYTYRDCYELQRRDAWDIYVNVATGAKENKNARKEEQKELVTDQVFVNVYAPLYQEKNRDCSSYSPEISGQTSSFTRTRTCDSYQERIRTYTVEGDLVFTNVDKKTITTSESEFISVYAATEYRNDVSEPDYVGAVEYCLSAHPGGTLLYATGGEVISYYSMSSVIYGGYPEYSWSTGWVLYKTEMEPYYCEFQGKGDLIP